MFVVVKIALLLVDPMLDFVVLMVALLLFGPFLIALYFSLLTAAALVPDAVVLTVDAVAVEGYEVYAVGVAVGMARQATLPRCALQIERLAYVAFAGFAFVAFVISVETWEVEEVSGEVYCLVVW